MLLGANSVLTLYTTVRSDCYFFLCVQATATVEVDTERAEKLQVTRSDFMGSLNNDIKPVSISLLYVYFKGQ